VVERACGIEQDHADAEYAIGSEVPGLQRARCLDDESHKPCYGKQGPYEMCEAAHRITQTPNQPRDAPDSLHGCRPFLPINQKMIEYLSITIEIGFLYVK